MNKTTYGLIYVSVHVRKQGTSIQSIQLSFFEVKKPLLLIQKEKGQVKLALWSKGPTWWSSLELSVPYYFVLTFLF